MHRAARNVHHHRRVGPGLLAVDRQSHFAGEDQEDLMQMQVPVRRDPPVQAFGPVHDPLDMQDVRKRAVLAV